jgi:trehalose 6-phosphate phosphatase
MDMLAPSVIPDLRESAILLDVDGTLVDLAPTPREVWVPPSLRHVLALLTERTGGALALVSGRAISDLDMIFAPLLLTAVGGHGAEFRTAGDGVVRKSASIGPELKRQLAAISEIGPGVLVEDKGYSLALHYRLAPDKGALVRSEVERICAQFPAEPIEILPGKQVIEVKPSGFNKATGVRMLMAQPPFAGRRPIFIGDDLTDECVFDIMPGLNGLAISVGRRVAGVPAYFESPECVRDWLSRIAENEEKAYT